MKPCLIIPAAGKGSRLGSSLPKVISLVNGQPMLSYLFKAYQRYVSTFIVVVHPSFRDDVEKYCLTQPYQVELVIQESPTGMLDAILLAKKLVEACTPEYIWITWCDQIAVHPITISTLREKTGGPLRPDLLFPTVTLKNPYTHLVRSKTGEIRQILHRRENDIMPDHGESEMGLFCLSRHAFEQLAEFSKNDQQGMETQERNFLPFIPWFHGKGVILTFPAQNPMEALGINTPEERRVIEGYLNSAAFKMNQEPSDSVGSEA